ncbi:hypothetical protein [Pseudomonas sp. HY7a-MNA-CIBAN-0227]|uniref:hypothetical protein n=1 Tax=Pseudomonas sp. HY7a-MNA-CIBAN-0227 TaxID=3140474 RepID=UPI00331A50F2
MSDQDLKVTPKMQLKDKVQKVSGNLIADLLLLTTATVFFSGSGIYFFLHPEYAKGILSVFFLSLIATLICMAEVIHSTKTLQKLKQCEDESESKLIEVDRVTYAHFHTAVTLMAFSSGIILLFKI